MSARRWIRAITALCLAFSVLSLGSVSAAPVLRQTTVFEVTTVDALYSAVYNEDGMPRENAEITLAAGIYPLEPDRPFDGRLVLGAGSTLKSEFAMGVDGNGVPEVDDDGPVVVQEGAKIDGSALVLNPPTAEGIVVVGEHGLVERLWIAGGNRPGLEITSHGTARHVASTGHSIGFRVRAAGQEAKAVLEQCLAADNWLFGIGVIGLGPSMPHPTYEDTEVQATIDRAASVRSGNWNLLVYGGLGTDGSEVHAKVYHSVFRSALSANVMALGGITYFAHGGGSHNEVKLTLVDSLIADGPVGLSAQGGVLWPIYWDPELPAEENENTGNQVNVSLSATSFAGNATDIVVYGAFSGAGVPSGHDNEATVVLRQGTPGTTTQLWPCFPSIAFPSCTNVAKIVEAHK